MNYIKLVLKGRLKLIADMVPRCEFLYDIGTDHAYIPIVLVKNGICKKAFATDIKKGPVEIAKRNISKFGLSDCIEAIVIPGITGVQINPETVVVIAGMGGVLISQIINESLNIAKKIDFLILQPMNAIDYLREWLYTNGFDIIDEKIAVEYNKMYNVLKVKYINTPKQLDKIDYLISPKLIENKDIYTLKYINKWIDFYKNVISGLSNSKQENKNILLDEYTSILKKLENLYNETYNSFLLVEKRIN